MEALIQEQGCYFLLCFLAGCAMAFSYDVIRVFRRILPHKNVFVAVEDVLFWLLWTILVLHLLHVYADGRLRWYMLMGLLAGVLTVENTIGSGLIKFTNHMLCLVEKQRKKKRNC